MTIDELLNQAHECGTEGQMSVPDSWGQGRTLFGGLSAALAYRVLRDRIAADRVARNISVSFVGPIATDRPFGFEVDILREGKNVTQAQVRIVQDGKINQVLLASFGVARESSTGVANEEKPPFEWPEKPVILPHIPSITPQFFQHVDVAMVTGGYPFSGVKTAFHGGYMRFKQAPAAITDAHLIALIDTWPPTLLQQLKQPAPASSLAWNMEFLHPHKPVQPDDWFAYHCDTRQAGEGYGHSEASIWDAHGELVAISRQTVTVFA